VRGAATAGSVQSAAKSGRRKSRQGAPNCRGCRPEDVHLAPAVAIPGPHPVRRRNQPGAGRGEVRGDRKSDKVRVWRAARVRAALLRAVLPGVLGQTEVPARVGDQGRSEFGQVRVRGVSAASHKGARRLRRTGWTAEVPKGANLPTARDSGQSLGGRFPSRCVSLLRRAFFGLAGGPRCDRVGGIRRCLTIALVTVNFPEAVQVRRKTKSMRVGQAAL
jgi:hypothetical protein